MPCTNAVCDTALNYVRISRRQSSVVLLPFLYQTQTIQLRRFHPASHTADEEPSINTTGPTIRFTGRSDNSRSTDHSNKPRYDRDKNYKGSRNIRGADGTGDDWSRPSFIKDRPKIARQGAYYRSDVAQDDPWSSPPTRRTYEEDDLPFEDDKDTQANMRPDNSSTMTDLERDAFSRLFGSLASKPQSKASGYGLEEDDDEMPSFVQELDELERKDRHEYDIESILDQELQSEAPKLEKYPVALRGMAAKAQLQVARDKLLRDRGVHEVGASKNEVTVAAEAEISRLWKKISFAGSDTELWNVLEQEMFSKIRKMELDKAPARKKATTLTPGDEKVNGKSATKKAKASSPPSTTNNLAVIARVYPSILHRAIRLLTTRLPHSPLIPSLLPACKSLGISSYILGVSTPFYNELLSHTWRFSNDMRTMLTLLQETSEAGLTLDMKTWQVLEKVTLYRYRALRGDFGEGLRVAEGMSERMREGKEVFEWKRDIRRALEQAALDRVREMDAKRRLEMEEEEDGFDMNESQTTSSSRAATSAA